MLLAVHSSIDTMVSCVAVIGTHVQRRLRAVAYVVGGLQAASIVAKLIAHKRVSDALRVRLHMLVFEQVRSTHCVMACHCVHWCVQDREQCLRTAEAFLRGELEPSAGGEVQLPPLLASEEGPLELDALLTELAIVCQRCVSYDRLMRGKAAHIDAMASRAAHEAKARESRRRAQSGCVLRCAAVWLRVLCLT